MLENISLIRAAAVQVIENEGYTVFVQRSLNSEALKDVERFVTLTIPRSSAEDDGSKELWRMPMNIGCYIENPSTDDDLEAFALIIKTAIEAEGVMPDYVNGLVYQGHNYPNEQGDDYAALDIEFELILS